MAHGRKPGRNERCPCGSGRKFKSCCGALPRASTTPSSTDRILRAAAELLRAGQYEDAIGPLLEAARLVPNNPTLLHDLGIACLLTRRLPDAVAWLTRSIALQPGLGRAHYSLGLALGQMGEDDAALESHRRAIAHAPELAEAHGQVAALLLRNGRPREAASVYQQASATAPGTIFGRLCEAKALAVQDRSSEAETELRRIIAIDPSNAEAHQLLGLLLSRVGRFDEATPVFERLLALAPGHAVAYQGLVSSRCMTEADRPLVAEMSSRVEARNMTEEHRMQLHFSVGKALDDLGDYAGAIRHIDAANGIRRRLSRPFVRARHKQRIDRLIARFGREFFSNNARMGSDDETPLFVLGMPRSGTTLVERILSSHPKIAGGDEFAFWNQHGGTAEHAEPAQLAASVGTLRDDYLRVLRGVDANAIRVTDKMPFNFTWIGLIHVIFPNARIIHCRRNSLDTCLSIYSTCFTANWGFASDRGDLAWYYEQYVHLMNHWRAVIPAGRLVDVDYEELTMFPERTARRLVAFTGLEWDPACLEPERNANPVKTANMWQARQPIYRSSVERWRRYEPWLGELRQLSRVV
jgi:Flp pilus assembly protein TadD